MSIHCKLIAVILIALTMHSRIGKTIVNNVTVCVWGCACVHARGKGKGEETEDNNVQRRPELLQ